MTGPAPAASVVVVDDDTALLRLIEKALGPSGLKVVTTSNPDDAISLVRQHMPSLVLLDLHMPSVDGLTLLEQIRTFSNVPVVMLTASDKASNAVQALKMGAQDYLTKPVDLGRLRQTVDAAVALPASGSEERKISHYNLVREVGRGGMGIVYEATDETLNRRAALKVLLPALAADPHYALRFLREARAAANLSHPGLVTVYEAGRDRGKLFIAMEFVDGRTLLSMAESGHKFSVEEATQIVLETARALEAAHAAGLVHRDVKPGNIMKLPAGGIKLLDFGLVRTTESAKFRLTERGGAVGTLGYASPESLRGELGTPKSDIYSLGVVYHELLANEPAFEKQHLWQILDRVAEGRVRTPLTRIPGVPAEVVQLVTRMMSPDPRRRPSSMAEVAQVLSRRKGAPNAGR